ncbi:iron ABC transporter permease, partial [Pseudoalteromonas sp. SG41-5]|uniref:FecCD family ABC transporter permease n=1 Tax=Pseudoalteromonas sp. SG41-5 TaxID=2760975 RepID=UPI0016009E84
IALSFGAAPSKFIDVYHSIIGQGDDSFIARIIWQLRMPRTLLAFLAGSGLAIAVLILQTVTRNPLADPYLFGISSGASFGVVCFMTLTGASAGITMSAAAFVGSLLTMLLLVFIAGRAGRGQVESMLLAGVALSFLFSAFTSLLLYFSDPQAITAILFWTLGSFARAQWSTLWLPALVIISCTGLMMGFRRQLNAMLLGDESAATLGIPVQRFRLLMLVLSSLITAVLVAMCGGIGFVGLMIPHIVRFFVSQGTITGLIMTALVGGIFMVWVDVLSRVLLANQELPIGVITSAIGSIFFLSLLYFRKRES